MIDNFDNEELKDPTKIRIVIKQLQSRIDELNEELKELDGSISDDEKGLKIKVRDLISDVKTLNRKLESIIEAQQGTRKTIKNTSISAGVTAIVSAVIAFVLKQLGIM